MLVAVHVTGLVAVHGLVVELEIVVGLEIVLVVAVHGTGLAAVHGAGLVAEWQQLDQDAAGQIVHVGESHPVDAFHLEASAFLGHFLGEVADSIGSCRYIGSMHGK